MHPDSSSLFSNFHTLIITLDDFLWSCVITTFCKHNSWSRNSRTPRCRTWGAPRNNAESPLRAGFIIRVFYATTWGNWNYRVSRNHFQLRHGRLNWRRLKSLVMTYTARLSRRRLFSSLCVAFRQRRQNLHMLPQPTCTHLPYLVS